MGFNSGFKGLIFRHFLTPQVSRYEKWIVDGRKYIQGSTLGGIGRDSSVGIATRYGLDGPGIESRWGARFSSSFHIGPGVHPASYTMGTGSFQGVKRAGRGVDYPPHLAPRLRKE